MCAPAAKFCRSCGASLVPRAADASEHAEARKVVTIVFADLIGSTALHERLDPESVSRVMERYHRAVRVPVEAHGGKVVQLLGDGVMCAFGVPRVAEDDAIRAVRASVAIQQAFRDFAEEERGLLGSVGLRVAVNTGEVVVSDDYAAGIGDPLNVAARLQQEARDGDVLIGESTERLVSTVVTLEPIGKLTLKGRAETVAAFRVVSLDRPAGASAVPFVGREDEIRRILAAYDAVVGERRARLTVILGSPGLGKSRLVSEVTRRLGEGATLLTAHCEAAGGATFAPIARALRTHLRVDDGAPTDTLRSAIAAATSGEEAERKRIADGIAALVEGRPASPEETFFVIRRFLSGLAAAKPVVLEIDDLHWAEPLLLDLTEHLVQWATDTPLLILAAARPELREARSSLTMSGGLVADVVTLAGLDAGAATRLAANVIGADELPAAVAGRVLATSEGNPLFVGELVRMLVQEGALKREGNRWTTGADLARLEMPPTIQALLAARIERLRPEERAVLERAAVVGRQFSRAAVGHLLPRDFADLDARLEALRRTELVESDTGWFLGEPLLRFRHVLIRDAAYRRVLKGTRAELHSRFAEWVVGRVGEGVEHDETIGWHLEQAHQHLRELGPLDAQGRALGERAASYLAAAGRRALARDDLSLAGNLLGRALDRLDEADAARADLALDWCEALLAAGEVGLGARATGELGRFTTGSDRLRAWHTCFVGQLAALSDPQGLHGTVEAVAAAAETLAAAGDTAGEAKAHSVHALALARLGRVGACETALDRALAAARRAQDRRRANAVLAGAPPAALWGPSPVNRASGRCLDVVRVLRITQGAPAVEAVALRCQAVLEALRGRGEAARRMIASSRRLVEELGIMHRLLEADVFAGLIELLEGENVTAERLLRAAYDGLRDNGLAIDAAQAAAFLARALLEQDRAAEAETLSHESEALAGDDLQAAIAWRGVRAEALAKRGEHLAAIAFARAAVDLAAATDALLIHADARLSLAAALRAAGQRREADAEERRATELWEAKGATLLAERARRQVGSSQPAAVVRAVLPPPVQTAKRRIAETPAIAGAGRMVAATAAKDLEAIRGLLQNECEYVDHGNGTVMDRDGILSSYRALFDCRDSACRMEILAGLGDELVLFRVSMSSSGTTGERLDAGPFNIDFVQFNEIDRVGRVRRSEGFRIDCLGDAVARFYERYAELLPEGPERSRAAATARAVAAHLGPAFDLDRYATALAPDLEFTDHRRVAVEPSRGAAAWLSGLRPLLELTDEIANRVDDVLALRSDAFLVHCTNFGTSREGGGAYERPFLWLAIFGPEGLASRTEIFDTERKIDALARFDEVTARPLSDGRVKRRVPPNAATVHIARLDAAVEARDSDAVRAVIAPGASFLDHTTGKTWDQEGGLASLGYLLRAENPQCRHEPLATLGDSLLLCRESVSASRFSGGKLDVGAYEREQLCVIEVDGEGRQRVEFFAPERLGDAVLRLYERYAELLPDGVERDRAAAVTRSLAGMLGPLDFDRWAAVLDPSVENVHHRTLGTWSSRGAEAFLQNVRSYPDVAENITLRIDDVLAATPDAVLPRWTAFGTDRAGGGTFERPYLQVQVFGSDGRLVSSELFDADRDVEAIARFDELVARPPSDRRVQRQVQPNAAISSALRFDAIVAERNADALPVVFADTFETFDHTTWTRWDRSGIVSSFRALLRATGPTCRHEALASLGDSLALFRFSASASRFAGAQFDVAAYQIEYFLLVETDGEGRRTRGEVFAVDHLGDAVARLYERYAEVLSDGPERTRAAATARSIAGMLGRLDLERWAALLDPSVEVSDHRTLGTWSARGADAFLRNVRSYWDVAEKPSLRIDDVLAAQPHALVVRWMGFGTDREGGGRVEWPYLRIDIFGGDGRLTWSEVFNADRHAEALARFEELTAGALQRPANRRVRPNAATANIARVNAALAAKDGEALAGALADTAELIDHTSGDTVYDRPSMLFTWQSLLKAKDPRNHYEPIATLGESLALCHETQSASAFVGRHFDVGAYEREGFELMEVDERGLLCRCDAFAIDHLGEAIVRLYERYAELLPVGPESTRATATARSLAAWIGAIDFDRMVVTMAPGLERVDHRPLALPSLHGSRRYEELLRTIFDAAGNLHVRFDDVLALRANALLVRLTNTGTERIGGGPLEWHFLWIIVFGPDGLVTRLESFASDSEAEALERFDELTARPQRSAVAQSRPAKRRVGANAATAHAARLEAAIAEREVDAFPTLLADEWEVLDHVFGATWDRNGTLATWHGLLAARDPTWRLEPLAILGDSLALCRLSWSARGYAEGDFDVGAYDVERIALTEVDAHGRGRRSETFAPERLGDAIVRLYERYTDLLPDGPARRRASATARSVSIAMGPFDPDLFATAQAKNVEGIDHRAAISWGSVHGVEEFRRAVRSLLELAADVTPQVHDVVALRHEGFLISYSHFGIERIGGGPFERHFLVLWIFGVDGLATNVELFDVDRRAEALARFDELTAERPGTSVKRRVRPNAATAHVVRLDAAMAARDLELLATLWADDIEVIDHLTGSVSDRQGLVTSHHGLLRARDLTYWHEVLATLGDSLALTRLSASASAIAGQKFDVGANELERFSVVEVDAQGRARRVEDFPAEKLEAAGLRLYERYAELLPEGSERERAAATARSIAAMSGPWNPERQVTAIAPAFEFVDHRPIGMDRERGPEAFLRRYRSLSDVADHIEYRGDDILALRPDAFLMRVTNSGIERIGGGAYERKYLILWAFGADGLATRQEMFDTDAVAEALARFDELTSPRVEAAKPERRVRPNAATASAALLDAAIAARDGTALSAVFAAELAIVEHYTGATYDREALIATWRSLWKAKDPRCRIEPLATLGDSLALCRVSMSAKEFRGGTLDVAAYEREEIILVEAGPDARVRYGENFALDHLGDAIARLYERHGELLPDGPEKARGAATARSAGAFVGRLDFDRMVGAMAPAVEFVDHRMLGFPRGRGAEHLKEVLRSLFATAADVVIRVDDTLALRSDTMLLRVTNCGTERVGGGSFERPYIGLWSFGADGALCRAELFDAGGDAEALERFEALTTETVPRAVKRRVGANAATAQVARLVAAVASRDGDKFAGEFTEDFRFEDHATGVTYDRRGILASFRSILSARDPSYRLEPLATLGESLVVVRESQSASAFAGRHFDVGAYAREGVVLIEVDERGQCRRGENFATDRLGEAIVRLYERYAELLPDGPDRVRATAVARSIAAMPGSIDPDRWANVYGPSVEVSDQRTLGTWSARGREEALAHLRSWAGVAENVALRLDDVLAARPSEFLGRWTSSGTHHGGGGTFERPYLMITQFGADGLLARIEFFDEERGDDALGRFDELAAPLPRATNRRVRPNAATAHTAQVDRAIAARDADALPGLFPEDAETVDHTTGAVFGREGAIYSFRSMLGSRGLSCRHQPLATLGESLGLFRLSIASSGVVRGDFDVGPYDFERVVFVECDASGRSRRAESFTADHLGDAIVRLYERYAELLPDGPDRVRAAATARSIALWANPFTVLDKFGEIIASTIEAVDHRILGTWSASGAGAFLDHFRSMLALVDDPRMREDEILGLRDDAVLVLRTHVGRDRAGGGVYERQFIGLSVFGSDGLMSRFEWFDTDREADALARLDEFADHHRDRAKRRLRPNAATALTARLDAAVAARDIDALGDLWRDLTEVVDHTAGMHYDRAGALFSYRSFFRSRDPVHQYEPLATLGSSLALCRLQMSASGKIGAKFDVGAYLIEQINLIEVGQHGLKRNELFSNDRLGQAVVRLYERYAELLPEGAERSRAAATARSLAGILGPWAPARFAETLAADVEQIDHRTLGTWSASGAGAVVENLRSGGIL